MPVRLGLGVAGSVTRPLPERCFCSTLTVTAGPGPAAPGSIAATRRACRDMGMPAGGGPPPNLGSGFNLKLADSPMLPIA
jgi:hypothetical protein